MNLTSWMTDTVGIGRHVGNSIRGDREYSLIARIKAKVKYSSEVFFTSNGSEGNSNTIVYTEYPVENDDRVWLPLSDFGDAGSSRPVKGVDLSISKNGLKKLYKVYL